MKTPLEFQKRSIPHSAGFWMNPHHGPAGRAPSCPCLGLERWPVTYPELNLAQLARGLGLTPDLLTIAVLSGHGSTCFPRTTQSSPERNGRPKLKAPRSDRSDSLVSLPAKPRPQSCGRTRALQVCLSFSPQCPQEAGGRRH